jgi:O-antigen ligase
MIINLFLRFPLLAIALHIGLGFITKYQPAIMAIFYVVLTMIAVIEIIIARDKGNLAAYYAIYVAGLEILSRMSKLPVFWEFGKYAVVAILGAGSFLGSEKQNRPYLLLIYFLFLLPGIIISATYGGMSEERILDLVSQYLSGPMALLATGWYFYQRPFTKNEIGYLIRIGILPSIAIIMLLFLGKSLSEIDFVRGSNFDASGGFGPNQVSSALGWGIVLLVLGMLFKLSATNYLAIDIVLLSLLVFRGLLTFSRGGMMGAFGALGFAILILYSISHTYRKQMRKVLPKIGISLVLLISVAIVANDLTDNYLLYRYQGKTTSEVILGRSIDGKDYFSGREDILDGELKAFAEKPILGIGIGRGTIYRESDFRSSTVASHTEFTRMLAEHGLLGLISIVCAFIILPFRHFLRLSNNIAKQWMLTLFVLSFFILMHSGMRLVLPCIAFGLGFIFILPEKNDEKS